MSRKSSFQPITLCWCGSGQKYKDCHFNRDKQIPVQPHEAFAEFRRAFSRKYCLHPQSSQASCSRQIVKAHSVSVSSNLSGIAEDGHVMQFRFLPNKLASKDGGHLYAQSIGINKASTFTGFCQLHDSQTFAKIDQPISTLGHQHCFLLAYRALCLGLFTKQAAFALCEVSRHFDKGTDISVQHAIQEFIKMRELGLAAGLRVLQGQKAEFDDILLSGKFDAIHSYVIELDHRPELVCSIGLTPETDCQGNKLQLIEYPQDQVDVMTCSIIATKRGAAIVFAWLNEPNRACSGLIDSIDRLKVHLLPSAIIRLVFEHGENVFFSPSWWNSLSQKEQIGLERRANSMYDKPASVLLDDGLRPVLWSIVEKRRSPTRLM
jgi:hypothetical protein